MTVPIYTPPHYSVGFKSPPGRSIYFPFNTPLYLTEEWTLTIQYCSGNLRFCYVAEFSPSIQSSRVPLYRGRLHIGQEFKVIDLISNGLKSPLNVSAPVVKIALPYRTKKGSHSSICCYITLEQLEEAVFKEEKVDSKPLSPEQEDLDRFEKIALDI